MKTFEERLSVSERIAGEVAKEGGRAYFVGGFVRDRLMGRELSESPDIDIEVHSLPPEKLFGILESLAPVKKTGLSFGIYTVGGYDIDVAMPRRERATGRGHRDFETFVDPFIGEKKASERRDFTVNALMQDVLTGEVLDFWGGLDDMKKSVLRHVSDASFPEDPLRVLRAAQFSARLGFSVDPATEKLCAGIDITTLSPERVFDEMKKALISAPKPSVFFEFLKKTGQLSYWFPEIEALTGVPQDPSFHSEGDVWVHTMLVLDSAAGMRERAKRPLPFMLSALCHDLGKPMTTEEINGRIHSYGHDEAGVGVASAFLSRLTSDKKIISYVKNMVLLHMRPNVLAFAKSSPKSTNKMFDTSCEPSDLILLATADCLGMTFPREYYDAVPWLEERFALFTETMSRPCVTGADLIAAGYKPGEDFSDILAYSHKLRLAGIDRDSALRQTLAYAEKKKKNNNKNKK